MITGVRIAQPPGPLAVSDSNLRYFSAAAAPEEAVYLTGSHVRTRISQTADSVVCPDGSSIETRGVPPDPSEGEPSFDSLEPARYAMGDTEQINLITMQPRTDLSSTGFALANPGTEYLILQPSETTDPFTVALTPGQYAVEWHSLPSRDTVPGAVLTIPDDSKINISAPSEIAGPAVVHLRRISS
jgi:hypothetical protein